MQELRHEQKQIGDSLEAMQRENKIFIKEFELVPYQMQANFLERCVLHDLLKSKMQ